MDYAIIPLSICPLTWNKVCEQFAAIFWHSKTARGPGGSKEKVHIGRGLFRRCLPHRIVQIDENERAFCHTATWNNHINHTIESWNL